MYIAKTVLAYEVVVSPKRYCRRWRGFGTKVVLDGDRACGNSQPSCPFTDFEHGTTEEKMRTVVYIASSIARTLLDYASRNNLVTITSRAGGLSVSHCVSDEADGEVAGKAASPLPACALKFSLIPLQGTLGLLLTQALIMQQCFIL
jgi:hypothetical protein